MNPLGRHDRQFDLAGQGQPLVVRGGSYRSSEDDADASLTFRRYLFPAQIRSDHIGFRVVMPLAVAPQN